ncbi:hypothetical protein P3W33_18015 [Luteibacter sp. PPL552]
MKKRSQDDFVRTALRVPPTLHAQLHDAAKLTGRTFNAEIVNRLENSFDPTNSIPAGSENELAAILELLKSINPSKASVLPSPEWSVKDFAAWPEQASLSDMAMFFAILSHVDYNGSLALYEAMTSRDAKRMKESFDRIVSPLLRAAPYPPLPIEPEGQAREDISPTPIIEKPAHRGKRSA